MFIESWSCDQLLQKAYSRVLKWWHHKNEVSEIMGFVRIFWKNNVHEAYLPKMSISGQIVSEMLAGYTRKTQYKPFYFFGGVGGELTRKNLEGFVWSFLRITGLWSQRRFAPKCSFLASRPLGHCYFRISWQIPWFQKFHFYDVTLKYSIARFRWGSSSHVEEMGLLFEK